MYNTPPRKSWFKKCYINFNIVLLSIYSLHFTTNLVPANIRIRITEIIILIIITIKQKRAPLVHYRKKVPSE
jgi:hypothetical protein